MSKFKATLAAMLIVVSFGMGNSPQTATTTSTTNVERIER